MLPSSSVCVHVLLFAPINSGASLDLSVYGLTKSAGGHAGRSQTHGRLSCGLHPPSACLLSVFAFLRGRLQQSIPSLGVL